MGESYQWDFGSVAAGLQFKVVFDGASVSVTCTSGYMDLNALWFSDGDKNVEGTVTLAKSDNSLNMNGTGITWDDVYKVSSTGLGSAGTNKLSFLTAGETISFSMATLDLPPAISALLASNPTALTVGVRVTSDSSTSGEGKYVDTSGTLISSVNHAPTLNTVSNATVNDTAGDDTYAAITGTLHGSDVDGNTVSYKLADSSATSGTGDSAGFNVQKSSEYGIFYLNTASGAYKFVANDAAVEGLKTTQTVDFLVSATDGTADSSAQAITITLNGVNDTPGLNASPTTHTFTDTSANDTFSSVTGQLSSTDRDAGDTAAYAIDGPGVATGSFDVSGHVYQQKLVGNFGTLYLDTSGAYEYVPNDSAIEALETSTSESFTLKVTDGSSATATKTLTINLTGAEDAPEVTAVVAGYTDTVANDTFADTTGTLSVSSRDGDTSFTFALAGSSATGQLDYDLKDTSSTFGTLYLNSTSGAYRFVANDAAIEALEGGSNPSAVYHVTAAADGATSADQTITINLTGAEDAPVVTAVVAGYTDTAADDTFNDTTGTLSVSSRDGDTSFTFALAGSSATGQLDYDLKDTSSTFGTLYLNSTTGAYKFVANDAAIEALEGGSNPSAVYHVTAAADGATSADQTITINLTGAEDAPVVTAVVAGYTDTAADDTFNDTTGTLSVSSRDGDTSFTFALAGSSATGQLDYDLKDTSSTFGTLYLNSTTGAYKFVANDAAIEALEGGSNPSAVYHVTAAADGATSADQTITINLTGAEDAPAVAPVVASYLDTAADDTFNDTTGTLSVSSRDGDTSFTFALAGSSTTGQLDYDLKDTSSTFGTLYLNSTTGAYKFVANDAAIEALEGGSNPSAVYHVTAAADGVTSADQTITINLTGAEDAPEVTAVVAGYTDTVANDTFADTTGTLSVSSRDGDTSFTFSLAGSSTTGQLDYDLKDTSSTFGTLYLNSTTGAYKFVANDAAIEALEGGSNPSAVYHVTAAADGVTSADQTTTINLTGAEDAPEVTAVVAGYTDTVANDTFADTTGTLSVSSRDGDTSFTFALAGSSTTGQLDYDLKDTSSTFGTLYLNSTTGAYKFVANDAAIEALEGGSNPSAVYHVTAAADGVTSADQTITINLTGAEDAPVVTAVVAGYTDTAADDTFNDTTGTLSVSSRDGDTSFTFALAGSSATGQLDYDLKNASSGYGTLYLNSSTGAYKFVANDAAIEGLEGGNNPSAFYHVTAAADGATSADQTITVNFTGAEDAPVVAPVVASYSDTAADDTFADKAGTLGVSSRDGDTSFTFTLAGSSASGMAGYDLQNTSSTFGTLYLNSTSGAYKFVANDAAIEALQSGSNPNLVYGVTAAADGVTSANQSITIGITGGNDAPRDLTLTADTSNSFVTGNAVPGNNGAIGTISVTAGSDPDAGGAYSFSLFSAMSGALGSASISTNASALFAVSSTGALSSTTALASGTIYEVTVQASQGSGATLATYSETFSIVTGTNAGTETLPGGGYDFSSGDDVIYGRQNVDIILAGSGNDTVFGQDGNDEIHGGTGIDLLFGGKDNDSFVFSSGDTGITLATADTIGDFNSANDTIVTSLAAGNVTIANGSSMSDFNAFVAAANASMASGTATSGSYMAWNAAGTGNGWLAIDENHSNSVDSGDSLIVLTGVNTAAGFATTDIA